MRPATTPAPRAARRRGRGAPDARVLKLTLAAALLVALGVFHIWSRTRVLDTGYALGELTREHHRLSTEHDRLRIEVETLRSPAALERYARTTLGMAPPAPGAVLAAGPRLASASPGWADGDGVGHRRHGPAEPVFVGAMLRAQGQPAEAAPERAGGPGGLLGPPGTMSAGARAAAARDAGVPGERLASRGPLRAGRAPLREQR